MMLKVTAWDDAHENNRTRELKRLEWVPVPNRMDGDGYTQLVDHEDGAAHLGAWIAILEIASRCNPRGFLVKSDGKPHDAHSLSRISRLKPHVFMAAIPRLLSIGWLVEDDESHDGARIPHDDAGSPQDHAPRVRAHTPPRAPAHARVLEGKGKKEGEGTREDAPEVSGVSPAPPPPVSASPLSDPETVLGEFIDIAKAITGTPYAVANERTELKIAAKILEAAPDKIRRTQAMRSAWLDPKFCLRPALTFFALDLDAWMRVADKAIASEKRQINAAKRVELAAEEARREEEQRRAEDENVSPEQKQARQKRIDAIVGRTGTA